MPQLPEFFAGRVRTDRWRAERLLVNTHIGRDPELSAILVDLSFADQEACVEPAVALNLRRQLDAGEDRAVIRDLLQDALAVDAEQDLVPVSRLDVTAHVGGPDAILPPSGEVRPGDRALEDPCQLSIAGTEAGAFLAARGPMPAGLRVAQDQLAEWFEPHRRLR